MASCSNATKEAQNKRRMAKKKLKKKKTTHSPAEESPKSRRVEGGRLRAFLSAHIGALQRPSCE